MSSPATPSNGMKNLKALLRVVVAAAILGGIYFSYAGHMKTTREVKDLSKKAHDLLQLDTPRDYKDAADLLGQALALKGTDPYALAAKAEVEALLWAEHGYADREQAARAAVAAADARDVNLAERFSGSALVKLASGNLDDAERDLLDVMEKGTSPARIVAAVGIVHARQGKGDVARNDFKQAADRDWRNPRFTVLQGEAFFEHGDFIQAQGAFEKAITMNRDHLRAIIGKARADVGRNERTIDALRTIEDVLGRPDEFSPVVRGRALTAKAEALLAQKKYEEAEAAAREALEQGSKLDPHYAFAHYTLGSSLAAQKKDGAAEAFDSAITHYPVVARFYFDGAVALAGAGQADAGAKLFDRYVESLKGGKVTDAYHLARSEFFRTTGDLTAAHAELDEALKLNDVNAETYYRKGFLFQAQAAQSRTERAKLFDEARQQYEKAVRVRERYPEVYRQMGLIYLDVNPRSAQALQNFAQALNYYKDQKAAKQTIDEFIDEVEQRYIQAGLRANATAWRREATALAR